MFDILLPDLYMLRQLLISMLQRHSTVSECSIQGYSEASAISERNNKSATPVIYTEDIMWTDSQEIRSFLN